MESVWTRFGTILACLVSGRRGKFEEPPSDTHWQHIKANIKVLQGSLLHSALEEHAYRTLR